jgi:vesicle coat complex subunit
MTAEGALDEEHFAGFNVHNKDTVCEMASMCEKLDLSNPECEGRQVDVEEWINVGKGIEMQRAIAYEDLINAIKSPDSESKTLENRSSYEEIVRDKISWSKAVDVYCTTLKFAESQSCYSTGSNALHSTFN